MTSRGLKYCLLLLPVFLFSCRIEKRLYTGGYYVSFPKQVKPVSEKKQNQMQQYTDLSILLETGNELASNNDSLPVLAIERTKDKTNSASFEPAKKNISAHKTSITIYKKPERTEYIITGDDDKKAEKDVKSLLFASALTFALSLIYSLAAIFKIILLEQILFVLLPFSIIGLWIFALMLRPKYFYEDEYSGKEKTEKSQRIITKKKAFLLAGFLGIFGAHRFYLGYTDIGLLEMFTLGGFFVLYFIDMLKIKSGKLKPLNGNYDNDNSTYTKVRKKSAPNLSQKLIKLGLLISIIALAIMLTFSLFVVIS